MRLKTWSEKYEIAKDIKELQISLIKALQNSGTESNREIELAFDYLMRLLETVKKTKTEESK